MDWINVTQNRVIWQVFMRTLMNLRNYINVGEFFDHLRFPMKKFGIAKK